MISRAHLLAVAVIVLAGIGLSAGFYPSLPETVPTHWNISGQADAFGPRWELVVLFPACTLGVAALMVVLPLLGPLRKNFEQFRGTYGRICITIVAGLLGIHLVVLLKAAGHELRIGATLAIVIGLMLAVMGNWLSKVRRNFYIGIRTPWTIANETVWEKTHRLGAKLFVVQGLVSAASGLFAPDWVCFVVLVGGLGLVGVWAVLYSLWCYRRLGQKDDLSSEPQAE